MFRNALAQCAGHSSTCLRRKAPFAHLWNTARWTVLSAQRHGPAPKFYHHASQDHTPTHWLSTLLKGNDGQPTSSGPEGNRTEPSETRDVAASTAPESSAPPDVSGDFHGTRQAKSHTSEKQTSKKPATGRKKTGHALRKERVSKKREDRTNQEDATKPRKKDKRVKGVSLKEALTEPKSWNAEDSPVIAFEPLERQLLPRSLAHGLERVLFMHGPYPIQQERTRVFNFDPDLAKLPRLREFDFSRLGNFVTPSEDATLTTVARKEKKKFVGSTSSLTGLLSQLHALLSNFRDLNYGHFSKDFQIASKQMTKFALCPAAVFLRYKKDAGIWAVDSDKEYAGSNVLSLMGQLMEKLLTTDKEVFEKYMIGKSHTLPAFEQQRPESYHYSGVGGLVVRSQLDAHDPRIPGTGMFDLKTRAVSPVRFQGGKGYEWGMDYEIRDMLGHWESFEREMHDMARATLLKYSLQVRLGRMDGIFIAYHNIARMFGFQYLSLADMDRILHGQSDTTLGDAELNLSARLLTRLFELATKTFPNTSIRIHLEARKGARRQLYFFAEPYTEDQAKAMQSKNNKKTQDWQNEILGLTEEKEAANSAENADSNSNQEADSTLTSPDTASSEPTSETASVPENDADEFVLPSTPLLACLVQVQNLVNGEVVDRVENLTKKDSYNLYHEIEQIQDSERAWRLYEATKKRRRTLLEDEDGKPEGSHDDYWLRLQQRLARQGRDFRSKIDRDDEKKGLNLAQMMWNDVHTAKTKPAMQPAIPAPPFVPDTLRTAHSTLDVGRLVSDISDYALFLHWAMTGLHCQVPKERLLVHISADQLLTAHYALRPSPGNFQIAAFHLVLFALESCETFKVLKGGIAAPPSAHDVAAEAEARLAPWIKNEKGTNAIPLTLTKDDRLNSYVYTKSHMKICKELKLLRFFIPTRAISTVRHKVSLALERALGPGERPKWSQYGLWYLIALETRRRCIVAEKCRQIKRAQTMVAREEKALPEGKKAVPKEEEAGSEEKKAVSKEENAAPEDEMARLRKEMANLEGERARLRIKRSRWGRKLLKSKKKLAASEARRPMSAKAKAACEEEMARMEEERARIHEVRSGMEERIVELKKRLAASSAEDAKAASDGAAKKTQVDAGDAAATAKQPGPGA